MMMMMKTGCIYQQTHTETHMMMTMTVFPHRLYLPSANYTTAANTHTHTLTEMIKSVLLEDLFDPECKNVVLNSIYFTSNQ